MGKIADRLRRPWTSPKDGKSPYLWMMSLSWFVWKYFYVRASALELAMLALTLATFIPVYLDSYWERDWRLAPHILFGFVLGMLWAPFNFGSCTFFIFGVAMCARITSPRAAYATMALILLSAVGRSMLLREPLNFILPALLVGIPIGVAGVAEAQERISRDRLLRKQEEIEHLATIAERERISRDLHDLLGHTLSLITLKAELAGKLLGRDAAACGREIKDIETCARHALTEVRSAVTGYRQTGFAHELDSARACLAAANVSLTANVEAFVLPATAENVMALTLREAVTNIVRHAGATRCDVSVALEGGLIVFRIRDDGAKLAGAAHIEQGNGLTGMRERAAALGGRLALTVERGLALELRLPMGGRGMIRVLIAEDQSLVLGALAALLRLEDDLDVVGQARNGREALELCQTLAPHIVLTDIEMPLMTGLELASALAGQGSPAKVMIVTTFARSGYLRRALGAGVRGYLLKDAPAETLAAAIRTVHAGGRAIAPELALEGWGGGQDPLNERERQVLRLAGEGKSGADIAKLIHLSEGTVRNYLSEAISKLGAGNRVEAFRMARDAGWL